MKWVCPQAPCPTGGGALRFTGSTGMALEVQIEGDLRICPVEARHVPALMARRRMVQGLCPTAHSDLHWMAVSHRGQGTHSRGGTVGGRSGSSGFAGEPATCCPSPVTSAPSSWRKTSFLQAGQTSGEESPLQAGRPGNACLGEGYRAGRDSGSWSPAS